MTSALTQELERETVQSAAIVNRLRLIGVSAFFTLTIVLSVILRVPSWRGNEWIFAAYWAVTVVTFFASRRSDRLGGWAMLAVAFVDVPMVFLLQLASFPTASSTSGVAGFTLGIYALLVVLSALSLRDWYVWATAAFGAGFEIALQTLAGVSAGGRVSSIIVLVIVAAACSYARRRLVELVGRVERDLEEREKGERALAHAGRMITMGTLAASVAHEIKNPLTAVLGGIALAERAVSADRNAEPSPMLTRALATSRVAADRVRVIVEDMTTFARVDDETIPDVDVNAVIETALAMAHPTMKHHVRVVRDLAPDVRGFGSPRRLEQVFLNLFINAAHAMPEERGETNELRVSTRVLDDGRACAEVADNGTGMSVETSTRIFEPFYTTKRAGTGLGLFICHGIVKALGGEITVESQLGKGTCFKIVLSADGPRSRAA